MRRFEPTTSTRWRLESDATGMPSQRAEPAGQRVVEQGGHQDAGHDGPGLAVAGRQHEREPRRQLQCLPIASEQVAAALVKDAGAKTDQAKAAAFLRRQNPDLTFTTEQKGDDFILLAGLSVAVNVLLALLYKLIVPFSSGYPALFFETNTGLIVLFVVGGTLVDGAEQLLHRLQHGNVVRREGIGPTPTAH